VVRLLYFLRGACDINTPEPALIKLSPPRLMPSLLGVVLTILGKQNQVQRKRAHTENRHCLDEGFLIWFFFFQGQKTVSGNQTPTLLKLKMDTRQLTKSMHHNTLKIMHITDSFANLAVLLNHQSFLNCR
jgi:hypothetical protein